MFVCTYSYIRSYDNIVIIKITFLTNKTIYLVAWSVYSYQKLMVNSEIGVNSILEIEPNPLAIKIPLNYLYFDNTHY